jgi:hypothetical protein
MANNIVIAQIRRALLVLLLIIPATGCAGLLAKPAIAPNETEVADYLGRLSPTLLNAPNLFVEVDYLKGSAPSEDALEHLKAKLLTYCDASVVEISVGQPLNLVWDGSRSRWGSLLDTSASRLQGTSQLLRVFYVPWMDHFANYGFYTTYRGVPVITVFKEAVRGAATLMITETKVESTLLMHEVAHGFGVPARGNHDEGTGHCTRPDCALYKPVDLRSILTNWWRVLLLWKIPDDLCVMCQEEIAAYQLKF